MQISLSRTQILYLIEAAELALTHEEELINKIGTYGVKVLKEAIEVGDSELQKLMKK